MLYPLVVLVRVTFKKVNVEHWLDNAGKGKSTIRRGTRSSAILSTINSHGLARHQSRAPW
jgi:hypothetical protein